MNPLRVVGVVMLIVAMVGFVGRAQGEAATAPATQPQASEMPKELGDLIDKGIALLDAGKSKEAIELMADPAFLAKLKEKGEYEKMLAKFAELKAARLLETLKLAKTQKPVLTEEGKRAAFFEDEKEQAAGRRTLRFSKGDDGWHLEN